MSSTTFGLRYPSQVSPGKIVYADGSGDAEDPYIAEMKLSGSGSYVLYVVYNRVTGEGTLSISIDLYQPNLQKWFPIANLSDIEDVFSLSLDGVEGEEKLYRIPIPTLSTTGLFIASSETMIRMKVVCSDSQLGGWAFVSVLPANVPSVAPHVVDGFTRIPTGGIKVNITDGLGGWKVLHEESFRESGTTLSDLGIGYYLITFDEEDGKTPPEDQFVLVIENQVVEISAEYTSAL